MANSWAEPINGSPPFILWEKLKRLRPVIRKLSKPLTDVQRNIISTREELKIAQEDLSRDVMNVNLINKVKVKTKEIIRWQELEEKVLQQKAKIDWTKLGDGNNHFFHASLKTKPHSKRMLKVSMEDGTDVNDKQGIEDIVLKFYGELMGSLWGKIVELLIRLTFRL